MILDDYQDNWLWDGWIVPQMTLYQLHIRIQRDSGPSVWHKIPKLSKVSLGLRGKLIKHSKENVKVTLHGLELGNVFLDPTPKGQIIKEKKTCWIAIK